MKKLAVANLTISIAMVFMLIVAEVIKAEQIFGVMTGVYWVLLDMAVLIVSMLTGVLLWKSAER